MYLFAKQLVEEMMNNRELWNSLSSNSYKMFTKYFSQSHMLKKMEEVYSNARLIDESQLDVSKALVLSHVKIKNQTNGMEISYHLVAESEADLKNGKISVTSPIGKGLLGKSVGEIAEIQVPNGTLKFEVLEISRD